ncbi:MAG: TolC family protein [Campylobacterales bacterium]
MRSALIMFCAALAAHALTLQEAVELTVKNHAGVYQAEASLGSARAGRRAADSAFWPTVNLSLAQNEREKATAAATQTTALKAGFNLFRGFADLASSRAAHWNEQAAQYELEGAKADAALEAKEAFYGYLKAKDTLLAAEESLRSARKQVADAEAFYAQGLIAAYERLSIQVEAANSEQKALKAASDLKVARLTLESLIGQPLPSEPASVSARTPALPDRAALRESQLKNRSEIQSLNALTQAQKQQVRKAVSGLLPTAEVTLAQEQYEYADGFSGVDSQSVTTLSLNWQLFNGLKPYHDREAALYQQRILESRLNDLKRQLALQLQSVYERYELAARAFGVVEAGLKLAEENYRIVKNRFDAQLASAGDLIDAEAVLWRAKEQYTLYYYDKLLALAELERVTQTPL